MRRCRGASGRFKRCGSGGYGTHPGMTCQCTRTYKGKKRCAAWTKEKAAVVCPVGPKRARKGKSKKGRR